MMSELPKIKELPYFKIQANAGTKLLRNAKTKLIDSPQPKKTDQLDEIAKPIAYNLCLLPTLKSKLEISVLLKFLCCCHKPLFQNKVGEILLVFSNPLSVFFGLKYNQHKKDHN